MVLCNPPLNLAEFGAPGNVTYLKFIVVTYTVHHSAMKNLKIAYNNSLRRLLGLPSHNSTSGMFVNLSIPSFGELVWKYVYSFKNRLETSDNVNIHGIYLTQFLLFWLRR